jgi:hypothetical protein
MADTDYVGIYAVPSTATMSILIPLEELKLRASDADGDILIDTVTGNISVVIPADTTIAVNNTVFTIMYKMLITVNPDTLASQVIFDNSVQNPLLKILPTGGHSSVAVINKKDYLFVETPVAQAENKSSVIVLNSASSFSTYIPFENDYCYCRAYIVKTVVGKKTWQEINVTHYNHVYDAAVATILIQVDTDRKVVIATIPDIYLNTGAIAGSIRIDVFTTRGPLTLNLGNITSDKFNLRIVDNNTFNTIDAIKIKALQKINGIAAFSKSVTTGGRRALTFQQVKDKVLYRTNFIRPAIREADIAQSITTMGFSITKIIDNITNKTYVASKPLSPRIINSLPVTPLITVDYLAVDVTDPNYTTNNLKTLAEGTINRTIVKPEGVFLSDRNGVITLMADNVIDNLYSYQATAPRLLCEELNANQYWYTPFHYVLDYNNTFTVRPYLLTNPVIEERVFEFNNSGTALNVSTATLLLEYSPDGFTITVSANNLSQSMDVFCQLLYIVRDGNTETYYYIDGELDVLLTPPGSSKLQFLININSSFDITESNQIYISNLLDSTGVLTPAHVNLTSEFMLLYGISPAVTVVPQPTEYDYLIKLDLVNSDSFVTNLEKLTIKFGTHLPNLYCLYDEVTQTPIYATYENDVYGTYSENIYQSNPDNPNIKNFTIGVDGKINFVLLHAKGDTILDNAGQPVVIHKTGDYILDSMGQLVPESGSSYLKRLTIVLVDARYKFCTFPKTKTYVDNITSQIERLVTVDIENISADLSERTTVLFRPSGKTNLIQAYTKNGSTVYVDSTLNIRITYTILKVKFKNAKLVDNITSATRKLIGKFINSDTLSLSAFTSALLKALPENSVLNVAIDSFLPNNQDILIVADKTERFNINEKLVVRADNSLDLIDTVEIKFVVND